jgi:hypothetical protein
VRGFSENPAFSNAVSNAVMVAGGTIPFSLKSVADTGTGFIRIRSIFTIVIVDKPAALAHSR